MLAFVTKIDAMAEIMIYPNVIASSSITSKRTYSLSLPLFMFSTVYRCFLVKNKNSIYMKRKIMFKAISIPVTALVFM